MGADSEDGTATFTRALASLKREGSNLLVVGDAATGTHAAACDRLLGEAASDRRRTLVTTTHGTCARQGNSPHGVTEIRYDAATRSAAGTATGDAPDQQWVRDLPALGSAINDAIETADRRVGGLDPAQFRLCIDSLEPLIERHSERAVFRFLHAATNEVRAAHGMGHYHLPLPPDSEDVKTIEPLFDAVVEVRDEDEQAQQRWRLTDPAAGTDWLPL